MPTIDSLPAHPASGTFNPQVVAAAPAVLPSNPTDRVSMTFGTEGDPQLETGTKAACFMLRRGIRPIVGGMVLCKGDM